MQRDDPKYKVGGGGQGGRQLETSIEEMTLQLQEMPPAPHIESLHFYSSWTNQSFFSSFGNENPAISNNNYIVDIEDVHSQMKASKFLNKMLMRLWRRRRAEVYGLHALIRKYKDHTERLHEELSIRDRLLSTERRRNEQLAIQLTSQSNNRESKLSKNREDKLSDELMAKSQECDNANEVLELVRKDFHCELAKYRECAQECATMHRRVVELRDSNDDLESELLELRKILLVQNDLMVNSINIKQEAIDNLNATLKTREHEFALLQTKYNKYLRLRDFVEMATRHYITLYNCGCHLGTCVLDYFMPSDLSPWNVNYKVRIFWALALLLSTSFL